MKSTLLTTTLTAALIAIPALAQASSDPASAPTRGAIVFEMTGFESSSGSVRCGLFDNKQSWLKDKGAVDGLAVPIEQGRAICTFEDVAPGEYGIVAHHDRDDDGKMDKVLGIPKEPYCFSQNARARFGPPSFAKASFQHAGGRTLQQAKLK